MNKILIVLVFLCFNVKVKAENQDLLASVLILEAGGERDIRAMSAVLEVIQNRAKERKLTLTQVVLQKKQFSCLNNFTIKSAINHAKKHKKWKTAQKLVLENRSNNYTRGANHYYADFIPAPYWVKGNKPIIKIEKHVFYKL